MMSETNHIPTTRSSKMLVSREMAAGSWASLLGSAWTPMAVQPAPALSATSRTSQARDKSHTLFQLRSEQSLLIAVSTVSRLRRAFPSSVDGHLLLPDGTFYSTSELCYQG
jgi:hypothetical protein